MTKEDAKEMIKMILKVSGHGVIPSESESSENKEQDLDPVSIFAEEVIKIIDRIDTGSSNLTYVPNTGDTYIGKCISDKDMFRIHPESGPFYGSFGKGPRDCYGNLVPHCGVNESRRMSGTGTPVPNTGNTISTSKDFKLTC